MASRFRFHRSCHLRGYCGKFWNLLLKGRWKCRNYSKNERKRHRGYTKVKFHGKWSRSCSFPMANDKLRGRTLHSASPDDNESVLDRENQHAKCERTPSS